MTEQEMLDLAIEVYAHLNDRNYHKAARVFCLVKYPVDAALLMIQITANISEKQLRELRSALIEVCDD